MLVGTGQAVPVSDIRSPTATGEVVAFGSSGSLETTFADGGQLRFRSPLGALVWALPLQNGGLYMVAETPDIQAEARMRMRLAMVGISANGKVQASFRRGPEVLPLPFFGQSWPASAVPVTVATNGKLSVIVSSTADGKALKLAQLPT